MWASKKEKILKAGQDHKLFKSSWRKRWWRLTEVPLLWGRIPRLELDNQEVPGVGRWDVLEGVGSQQCGSPLVHPTSCLLWWAVLIQRLPGFLPLSFYSSPLMKGSVLIYAEEILTANASQKWKRALMITWVTTEWPGYRGPTSSEASWGVKEINGQMRGEEDVRWLEWLPFKPRL